MKRFLSTALVLLLGPLSCFAQGLVPSRLVSIETSGLTNLAPQYATVQSALSWIDDNWDPLVVASGWSYLPTNAATSQAVFDWIDEHWFGEGFAALSSNVVANAATMSYNASANNWNFTNTLLEVFLDLFGNTNDAYRVIQDPAEFRSNYLAAIALNDTNASVPFGQYSNLYGRLDLLFYQHFTNAVRPYVDGGDSTNATLVWNVRDEIYSVLSSLGFSSFVAYGYTTAAAYTSDYQTYVVPTNVPTNTVIKAYAWGGGGRGNHAGDAGFTLGGLIVTNAETFDETKPECVTNGMVLRVQVGSSYQRAAFWRDPANPGVTNFAAPTAELAVAGGGGYSGGFGGGLEGGRGTPGGTGTASYGGTQSAGGAVGSPAGAPGERIWGSTAYSQRGGDGYYGGASGRPVGADYSGGGGGSGFIHPGMANLVVGGGTFQGTEGGPLGVEYVTYGANAGARGIGVAGAGARVAFEVPYVQE